MNRTWENGKPDFGPNFGPFGPNFSARPFQKSFLWVFPLLDVTYCRQVIIVSNFKENLWSKTQENDKKTHFGPDLGPLDPNFDCQSF